MLLLFQQDKWAPQGCALSNEPAKFSWIVEFIPQLDKVCLN